MAVPAWIRGVALVYFILHIPTTLLVDLQIILRPYYPAALTSVYNWWSAAFDDHLLAPAKPAVWFASFIWCEALLQLPIFCFMVYGLLNRKESIRLPGIIYSAHVATTLIPILAEFWFGQPKSFENRVMLTLVYCPYLLIPLLILYSFSTNSEIFGRSKQKSK